MTSHYLAMLSVGLLSNIEAPFSDEKGVGFREQLGFIYYLFYLYLTQIQQGG